ncbi:hypothetical protein LP417_14075 [Polaromonas sp. P1-6]|nr:hypothetical protein LP417_14075 [Polaromonas sp. P1-6]UUZ70208.1 hypothetical protein LP416_14340 [Polaromonas sp. P2-4]
MLAVQQPAVVKALAADRAARVCIFKVDDEAMKRRKGLFLRSVGNVRFNGRLCISVDVCLVVEAPG